MGRDKGCPSPHSPLSNCFKRAQLPRCTARINVLILLEMTPLKCCVVIACTLASLVVGKIIELILQNCVGLPCFSEILNLVFITGQELPTFTKVLVVGGHDSDNFDNVESLDLLQGTTCDPVPSYPFKFRFAAGGQLVKVISCISVNSMWKCGTFSGCEWKPHSCGVWRLPW